MNFIQTHEIIKFLVQSLMPLSSRNNCGLMPNCNYRMFIVGTGKGTNLMLANMINEGENELTRMLRLPLNREDTVCISDSLRSAIETSQSDPHVKTQSTPFVQAIVEFILISTTCMHSGPKT